MRHAGSGDHGATSREATFLPIPPICSLGVAHQCVFMRKPLLLLFLLALLPLTAMADAVEINGIYYNLVEKAIKIAEVMQHPNKYTGDVVIPEKVDYNGASYSVTSIGSSAFYGCSGLISVTIPNSVTSIGSSAFNV